MVPAQSLAETRVLRVIVFVLGIATIVFLLLAIGPITAQTSYLLGWWTPAAMAAFFGVPPLLAVAARWLSQRALRVLLKVYAIAFALAMASFVPAMIVHPMALDLSPWPLSVSAIGPVAAALAWRPAAAWLYLAVNIALVVLLRDFASGHVDVVVALQTGFFSLTFTAIFTALALVSMRNARAVDVAATTATRAAARSSSASARLRERARLDALVHDEILVTLFYATVGTPELDSAVARQAKRAIGQLEAFGADESAATVEEFTNRLRSATLALSGSVSFSVEGARHDEVPAAVASAFVEAAGEAVRNSIEHAGADGTPVPVDVVLSLHENSVHAEISDEGTGFNPRMVAAHRLGIRVSIEGRLAVVPGCRAEVRSRPGHGTAVSLSWTES